MPFLHTKNDFCWIVWFVCKLTSFILMKPSLVVVTNFKVFSAGGESTKITFVISCFWTRLRKV